MTRVSTPTATIAVASASADRLDDEAERPEMERARAGRERRLDCLA